ncbi:hypothetical protein PMAYCL1PPCAC_29776 [Pristionchus mayeri]|uniref:Membrane transporter n=1 Tax=Pristionchus mayeri TaxID=1317129 RepID=A0AAN5IEH9_9BILA|nr:hypothetical protein PMAYCL1PPCAC_29776 [Pristionchus mayeri]
MHRPRSDPNLDGEGRLEAVTLESEISMSVVTEASRVAYESRNRQRRFFDRITGRRHRNDTGLTDLTEMEEGKKGCATFNVEPALLLIALGLGIQMNSNPLFTYWARCIELAEQYHGPGSNSTAICSTLSDKNSSEFNDIVERDIASTRIYIQLAGTIPTVVVAPIIGNWSDHHGRKKPLLFALCGMMLCFLLQLISTITYERISIYDFAFGAEVLFGLCGGAGAVFSAILSIVTDECRLTGLKPGNSEVPMRIAVASGMQSMGGMFGALIMGWFSVPAIESVDDHVGAYVKSAILSLFMVMAAFVYTVVFVRETHRPRKELFEHEHPDERDYLVDESLQEREGKCSKTSRKLNQLVEVLTERRPGYTRFCLNLSLMFVFVEFLVIDANLLFLYVKRQPFAWSDRMFSLLAFFRGFCMFIGMIGLPLLMRKTNFLGKDSILIGLGVFSGAIGYFIISFASSNEEIVISSALALFGGAISPGYRSFLPRMVPKEQTARLLTCISIIIAFCPILSSVVFNNMFNWSIYFWPGLAFFVGGAFQAVVTLGQILIHCLMRPQWKLAEQLRGQRLIEDDEEEEEDNEERREQERRRLMGGDEDRSVSNEAVGSSSPSESRDDGPGDDTTMLEERRPVIL